MKHNSAIRRLFAVLVTAALVLAPVSRPAMAAIAPAAAMADQMVDDMSMSAAADAMDVAGMADDMPCCPSKAPAPVDCDKCAFMACMSAWVPAPLAANFEYLPVIAATLALRRDDARLVGLGQLPPERPPRVLV